jgi:MOSC domain-containing protein
VRWFRFIRRKDTGATVGAVRSLWRYPVKSMRGESVEHFDIDARGVVGDRRYAVRTAEGKFGSGKSTRRFRRIDGLLRMRAAYQSEVPEIVFPDGWTVRGDAAAVHAALSSWFDQGLTLARQAEVCHFDVGAIHILTSASLRWLQVLLPSAVIDERRFRPNLVLDVAGETQIEVNWIGKMLAVGADVRLRVTGRTERCPMIDMAQADLPADPRILDCLVGKSDAVFGVYADVIKSGRIRCGDCVTIADS